MAADAAARRRAGGRASDVLILPWDAALDEAEWREWLAGREAFGVLVVNNLDPARARGLHRHPARSAPGDRGSSWLHVSAGLGTNPYVRFRVACRPEATLLTLT